MADQVKGGRLSPLLRSLRVAEVRPFLKGRVLDFGCGAGVLARYCDPTSYLGVDADSETLEAATANAPDHRFQASLPDQGQFDTIVALAVIEHIADPVGLLKQFREVLATDGRIIVTTPNPQFESIHTLGANLGLFSHEAAEEHQSLLNRRGMAAAADVAGLRITSFRYFMLGANQIAILHHGKREMQREVPAQPAGNYYDKYHSRNPIARLLMDGFLAAFDRLVAKSGSTTMTEIGCGEGHLMLRAARHGLTVRGCDIAPSCVANAQELLADVPNARIKQRSIFDLQATEYMDQLVVCCEVLEHLDDPKAGLRILRSLASPYLLVSVPREPVWRALNMARGRYWGEWGNTPGHLQHWSASSFLAFLATEVDVIEVAKPLPWTMALCKVRS